MLRLTFLCKFLFIFSKKMKRFQKKFQQILIKPIAENLFKGYLIEIIMNFLLYLSHFKYR